jgi:glutaconate CoA-transferase, subunit B
MAGLEWSPGEMMAVAAASRLRDDDVAVVGLGLPQVAALLAQRTTAPRIQLLLELGVFMPRPMEPAMGIADPRMWSGAWAFGGVTDVLGAMLHGGRVTLGILGALQVDPTGSLNTTAVQGRDGSLRRFNGSGGGNDIASLAGRVLVVMRHDPRKFRPAVEFLTSPGRMVGGKPRHDAGLPGQGTVAIITDRAIIDVTHAGAELASVHPGESAASVIADTPMPLNVPDGGPEETPAPTAEQRTLLREELDPKGWYLGRQQREP